MNNEAIKALEGSILKWLAIADRLGVEGGTSNCALCRFCNADAACSYYDDNGEEQRCPVFAKTGRNYCSETPYYDFDGSHIRESIACGLSSVVATKPEDFAAARAEALFLISLHPEADIKYKQVRRMLER